MSNWKRNLLGVSDKVQCSTSRKNIFFSRILLVTLELLNWHVKCIVFVTYPLRSYARVAINGEIVYCYCYCWTIDRLPLAFTLDWRVSHHCSQSRQSHSEFSAQRKLSAHAQRMSTQWRSCVALTCVFLWLISGSAGSLSLPYVLHVLPIYPVLWIANCLGHSKSYCPCLLEIWLTNVTNSKYIAHFSNI